MLQSYYHSNGVVLSARSPIRMIIGNSHLAFNLNDKIHLFHFPSCALYGWELNSVVAVNVIQLTHTHTFVTYKYAHTVMYTCLHAWILQHLLDLGLLYSA